MTIPAVSIRPWIGLIVVHLFIPLILFGRGGNLGWRQAWAYSPLVVAAGVGGRHLAEKRHPAPTLQNPIRGFRIGSFAPLLHFSGK